MLSTGVWISAAMVMRSKNPVHSVFYLVLVFFCSSGLLFMLGMEFFALLQLLVYIGALAVMFLFVVMLLDIPVTEIVAHQRGYYPIAAVFVLILFSLIFLVLDSIPESFLETTAVSINNKQIDWLLHSNTQENLVMLGYAFYIVYIDLLILASLLLLVAMVGAVVLTLKKRVNVPSHDIFSQHNRDFQKVVYQIQSNKI